MVYGRLIYNNVKEYTPSWFKTLPYAQSTKPILGIKKNNKARQSQVVSKFNNDPKIKTFWRFLQRNVQKYPWVWQLLIFGNAYAIFSICYWPWLLTYQFNNQKRTLDYAIQQEKEYKATLPQDE